MLSPLQHKAPVLGGSFQPPCFLATACSGQMSGSSKLKSILRTIATLSCETSTYPPRSAAHIQLTGHALIINSSAHRKAPLLFLALLRRSAIVQPFTSLNLCPAPNSYRIA